MFVNLDFCTRITTLWLMTHQTPYAVENTIKQFGTNIRIARLRRNWSRDFLGAKLGLHRNVIARAEAGNPGVRIETYFSILWALGILDHVTDLASPERDIEGKQLALSHMRTRAGTNRTLDNDF